MRVKNNKKEKDAKLSVKNRLLYSVGLFDLSYAFQKQAERKFSHKLKFGVEIFEIWYLEGIKRECRSCGFQFRFIWDFRAGYNKECPQCGLS